MSLTKVLAPVLLLLCGFLLKGSSGDCVVVSIMNQDACSFDITGMLEAVSACAYPHFCTHVHRSPESDGGGRKVKNCGNACSSLGISQCAQKGCSNRGDHDGQSRRRQTDWSTTRLETHKQLKKLGLRHVEPSMCNSSQIIEEFSDETDQSFLKECRNMKVEIFTNGTFHS
mmetsp:Transcript_18562/g.23902  ORF Transcript_18562/g.23902 Transcript_18562/m.23902 type:complete len:171 (+) Transcript_18562:53-565(+)